MNYFLECFKKYADFKGRSRRSEFWYFNLFFTIISMLLFTISTVIGDTRNILVILYVLASIIPSLTVAVRRLHDVGKSGWMLFISLIPIVGPIWLLILYIKDSTPQDNKYGPNPKMVQTTVSVTPEVPQVSTQA